MPSEDTRKTYCRFRYRERAAHGLVEDGQVFELDAAPFGPHRRTNVVHELAAVNLLVRTIPAIVPVCREELQRPPWLPHIGTTGGIPGQVLAIPLVPEIRYESSTALIAHDDEIVKPRDSAEKLHYEGELVRSSAEPARTFPGRGTGSRIWVDHRQRCFRAFLAVRGASMWRSKNSDTFKPMGPWIVTVLIPDEMVTTVRANGTTTSQFRTGEMIFDVATSISEITKYITIMSGDALWMGTNGTSPDLEVGDVVEVEISGIGTLRNSVVDDTGEYSIMEGIEQFHGN